MSDQLNAILKILSLTNRFKTVLRNQFVPETSPRRIENDAEHTFEVALASWYLNQSCDLRHDSNKLFAYALVHDLVEIFTDDFDPFMHSGDADFQAKKKKMEEGAIKEFQAEFADAPEILAALENYEKREDAESRFVYAIDKVIGQVNVTEMEKRTLENCGISRDSLVKQIENKLIVDEFSYKIGQELLELFDTRKNFFAEQDYIPDYKKHKKTI